MGYLPWKIGIIVSANWNISMPFLRLDEKGRVMFLLRCLHAKQIFIRMDSMIVHVKNNNGIIHLTGWLRNYLGKITSLSPMADVYRHQRAVPTHGCLFSKQILHLDFNGIS